MKDPQDGRMPAKDRDMAKAGDQEKQKDKDKAQSARDAKVVALDLGHRSGTATLRLAAAVDAKGLDKTGVNGLVDALKKLRDKMDR